MVFISRCAPAILLVLSGCVSGPDYKPPIMPLPATFSEPSAGSSDGIVSRQWWRAYSDETLEALVARGLSQNITILSAIEAINAAQGDVVVAGSGGLPNIAVGADQTISGETGNLRTAASSTSTSRGGATSSWLLDFFGQYRRAREGALDSLDAAFATVDVARLAYVQDVVTGYINARYYQIRISIARENLKSRRDTLNLTKFQLTAGAASRLDVVQAEGLVNSTLSEVPGLEVNYRREVHHIAALLDAPAAEILELMKRGATQPVYKGGVSAGVPADLIRNRPDVRRDERQLAAAVAQIGIAQAQLLPSITLNGSISPSYIHTAGRGGGLTTWSFGPALNLPILDGGLLRANVKIAESNAKVAYLTWKGTVLTAVEEVENGLVAVNRDPQTIAALRAQVRSYRDAVSLSTASYKDGASSLLDVLDAQRSVTNAQQNLAAAVQQLATDYAALNVAIGAGFILQTDSKGQSRPAAEKHVAKLGVSNE